MDDLNTPQGGNESNAVPIDSLWREEERLIAAIIADIRSLRAMSSQPGEAVVAQESTGDAG